MGALSAVFWGLLLLSGLVFVHEGGHYLAARAFGMRVTEFFLGMPCRFKLSHTSASRGTEIGVTPILLGGYTRICGMDGNVGDDTARVLAATARLGRASVERIAAEAGLNPDDALSQLAILSDWASVEPYYNPELGEHKGQRDWPESFQTVRRDPLLRCAFDKGHDFSLSGTTEAGEPHALGGLDELAFLEAERAHTYQGKGFVARIITLVAGPAVNIVGGMLAIALVLSIGGVTVARNVNVVGSVEAGSMAEAAGVAAGDTISSVGGAQVSNWTEMSEALRSCIAAGEPFEVVFEHEGSAATATVDPADFAGATLFGVTATTELYHPNILASLRVAWYYVGLTVSYIAQLFQPAHTAEVVSQSTSIVGVSVMASEAAASGVVDFVYLAAAISLSLGFMNLVPIPPLDGGRMLIELVQLVLRRRVSARVQNGLSYVGLALSMLLFFCVLRQDIIRYILGG